MAIGSDYSQPVMVNGFVCWNCNQVAEAKKGENPAHPDAASGAAGPSGAQKTSPAVVFGGALASLNGRTAAGASSPAATPPAPASSGAQLDVLV